MLKIKEDGKHDLQLCREFPAIFSNTLSGKSGGNLRHFDKNELQNIKILKQNFPIIEHFQMNFRDLAKR